MSSIFTKVPIGRPKTNTFNLSHVKILSTEMGVLTPILCEEVLPGDKWRARSDVFIRLAPMLAPIMHNVNAYVHYFFVPNRINWKDWESFITGGPDGTDAPVFPRIQLSASEIPQYAGAGSLSDYVGAQTQLNHPSPQGLYSVNALPYRAYANIYNEYYRDQNLADPIEYSKESGLVTGAEAARLLSLRNRAWQKDYFTSALPFTQRGPEAVIPFSSSSADVVYKNDGSQQLLKSTNGANLAGNTIQTARNLSGSQGVPNLSPDADPTHSAIPVNIDPNGSLEVDFDSIGIPVNDLRATVALQSWIERNARGGGRYFEQILSHFHVTSPDSRLQRPEFLGGGKAPISISEVLQTQETTSDSPQGNMSGHGLSAGRTNSFSYFAQEHGFIIGILSVLPRTAYMQGTRRFFRKFDKFDYAFPSLAHLGEQEVFNFEVFASLNDQTTNNRTFGYQSRYAEYKYVPDSVHGDFRTTLRHWHMGRDFSARPALNNTFVTSDPTTRIYAVTGNEELSVHHLWCQCANHCFVNRRLPKFGVPKIVG